MDDKPQDVTETNTPLATLVEHEKDLAREDSIDAKIAEERQNEPLVDGDELKARLGAEDDGHHVGGGEDNAFTRAKAKIEGPGGDLGTAIEIEGVSLDELPILPLAVDAHGRLWALDHPARVLRLVGRVVK